MIISKVVFHLPISVNQPPDLGPLACSCDKVFSVGAECGFGYIFRMINACFFLPLSVSLLLDYGNVSAIIQSHKVFTIGAKVGIIHTHHFRVLDTGYGTPFQRFCISQYFARL